MRATAALAFILVACTGPLPWEVPTGCNQTSDYVFVGQSSFAALGISTGSSTDADTGYVWVTAKVVDRNFLSRPPGTPPIPPARLACALYPDGSAAVTSVPDDWRS